jgi:hypothetical protein
MRKSPWRKNLPLLEDEQTRFVREEPNSFTTIGSGEEARVLNLEVLQTLRVRIFCGLGVKETSLPKL